LTIPTASHADSGPAELSPPRSVTADDGHLCYVYGIVAGADQSLLDGLFLRGVDPAHPVRLFPYREIQAVVSNVGDEEFSEDPLADNLQCLQWLAAKAHAHEDVLEAVLSRRTIIPMRFCTIFRSESHVRHMLASCYDALSAALSRLQGKAEWGVKVYAEGDELREWALAANDRIRAMEDEICRKPTGAAYLWRRKLEEAISTEAERISNETAQRAHDRLSACADDSVCNPIPEDKTAGSQEVMILNAAYLVAEDKLKLFRSELELLQKDYAQSGFLFRLSGPWPAYNFVTEEIGKAVGSA